jgi:nucleotide-binding universal stress UspA family protein
MTEMSGKHTNYECPESKNNKIEKYFDKVKEMAKQNHVELITDTVTSAKSTSKVIVDYAEAKSFDLIVIGRIGKPNFRKYLVGGITSSVITHAHCPVMVIK